MNEKRINLPEYTVTELSGAVKRAIEDGFSYVRVRGELGRVSKPASGHVYLDLKDQNSVMAAVIWKGVAQKLSVAPEQGLEVIATGRLTTFPGQSKYQIIIESLEPAGEGALMALYEKRKKQLAAEGLFDENRKKPLPFLPKVIGVITSPSGAVIRDIIHRITDRYPVRVIIWPVRVQGKESAEEVARGIAGFNSLGAGDNIPRPDVLIVARGGGSLEDLWGFNEEIVARTASQSDIPLISAVGHETDWTLIDYVADLRAPTPTAAAEASVPVRQDLITHCQTLKTRQMNAVNRGLLERSTSLKAATRGLPKLVDLLLQPRQKLDLIVQSMNNGLKQNLMHKSHQLERITTYLQPHILNQQIYVKKQASQNLNQRFSSAQKNYLSIKNNDLARFTSRFQAINPISNVKNLSQQIQHLNHRLAQSLSSKISQKKQGLRATSRMLESLSYRSVLSRGYAVVRGDNNQIISKADELNTHTEVEIEFSDGRILVDKSISMSKANAQPILKEKPLKKAKKPKKDDDQTSLF